MGKQINRTDIWCNTISYCKKGGIQILQGLIPAGRSRLLYFKYPCKCEGFHAYTSFKTNEIVFKM